MEVRQVYPFLIPMAYAHVFAASVPSSFDSFLIAFKTPHLHPLPPLSPFARSHYPTVVSLLSPIPPSRSSLMQSHHPLSCVVCYPLLSYRI